MDEIQALLNLDWVALILGIFVLMSGIIATVTIVGKFSEVIGKPVKWVREKRKDHELIIENAKAIQKLSKRHEEDTKQSIRHDEMIRDDLQKLTNTVDNIVSKLETMQEKNDATEMAKLKDKIVAYYRKYSVLGEWEKFECDVFWGLFDSYIYHGGNSFVKGDIESVMRKLKIKN